MNVSTPALDSRNVFGNNLMETSLVGPVETVDELLSMFDLGDSFHSYVWRGQSCHIWAPYPTLIRKMRRQGFADSQINEGILQLEEHCIIKSARSKRLLDNEEDILEFMSKMQHYGGATRLLDVTHDPLIAAYFASSSDDECAGVIFRYQINPDNIIDVDEGNAGWNEVLSSREPGRPILINPKKWDRRIEVQKGAFVTLAIKSSLSEPNFYTNQTDDSEVKVILVSHKLKKSLRDYLLIRGISQERLFPSIERFAEEYGVSSPLCCKL